MKTNKITVCKHCGSVGSHYSFQCSMVRKPIKKVSDTKARNLIEEAKEHLETIRKSDMKLKEAINKLPTRRYKPDFTTGLVYPKISPSKPTSKHVATSRKKRTDSLPSLLELTEIVFNRWIRNTKAIKSGDKFKCTCCNEWFPVDEMDSGHMISKTYSATRFHEDNLWPQSQKCNRLEYGNYEQFKENVKMIIGEERFNEVERLSKTSWKWDRESLQELIRKYK